MNYDIILINPPYRKVYGFKEDISSKLPPLGLMYLSSYLKQKGFKVKIIDLEVDQESKLENILRNSEANVYGITSVTSTFPGVMKIAQKIKKYNKENLVIFGGPHATAVKKNILEVCKNVDVVVFGEGERTLIKLLENDFKNLDKIENIAYRKKDKILMSDYRLSFIDIDKLPFPDHQRINYKKYRSSLHRDLGNPFAVMMVTRGCPFRCAYCGTQTIFGRTIRFRKIEKVIGELEYLITKFYVRNIIFWDDTFTINKQYTKSLCKELKKYDVVWSCNTRPDCVDREILKEMKDAGCKIIFYGVESSSNDVLKKLGRNMTTEQIIKAIKITKEIGIRCTASMMVGTPFDTKEQIEKNIDFMIKLNPDLAFFSPFAPHPGTSLYNFCLKHHIIPPWKDWIKMQFKGLPLNHPTANNLLTREQIQNYLQEAYKKFYSRKEFFDERIKKWKEDWELKILDNLRHKFGGENDE
jgi:radical SAM superfamily enzyme YgiQ (UPF0313 family)